MTSFSTAELPWISESRLKFMPLVTKKNGISSP